MSAPRRWQWLLGGLSALAVLVLVLVLALVVPGHRSTRSAGRSAPTDPAPAGGTPAATAGRPIEGAVTCPAPTVTVTDGPSLTEALAAAVPGTSIRLADGVYAGRFVATASGTAAQPIFLCGGTGAVLDGGGTSGGYALHLDGVSYWRVAGFVVRNGQKGVMADRVQQTVIQGLTVEQIGDEGIHLRNFSTDNVVQGNTVRDTGLRKAQYGEGIYVGSARSNWCTVTACAPDRSDRNVVRDNDISATTAESVDIKEGTTGGTLAGNTFDGSALSGKFADSWVDVKGNGWLIEHNTGHNSRGDGFQTHQVVKGWGADNTFTANVADVNGPGFGFDFTPVDGNTLRCDNKATGAAKGLANTGCA
jgi:hypothetical protein